MCFSHIDSIVHKIYFVLQKLWFTASYLHSSLKLKLAKTLITPFLTYGANVFGDLDSVSFKKLQVSINNCARFVYNKRKYDHISQYSRNILGCTLADYLNIRNLLFPQMAITTKSPVYLYCKLKFSSSIRTRNLILPRICNIERQHQHQCFLVMLFVFGIHFRIILKI